MISWTQALAPGTLLAGRYRVEREIGRGGMALVFRARDEREAKSVALKVLRPTLDHSHLAVERLRREAAAYEALTHPNIVRLHEFVADGELAFLAMELVEGHSLKQKLQRDGQLSIAETLRIGAQIASALDAAHRKGVIHRDIKPQNVLLDGTGQVKVVDFGLARLNTAASFTATRTTLGTPEYMPPEQIQAQTVDPRADLYSLGVLLYECLAGKPPFTGADVFAILQQHLHNQPRSLAELRPEIPRWLEDTVALCLRKRREERFRSAAALLEALSNPERGTLSIEHLPVPKEALPDRCARCDGPAPELVGFCLHCGESPGSVAPRRVDELVSADRQRWEREDQELASNVRRYLPGRLGERFQRGLLKRQRQELAALEKQAREVEKLREELELPISSLKFDDQALLLLGGRRAVQRWRRRKAALRRHFGGLGGLLRRHKHRYESLTSWTRRGAGQSKDGEAVKVGLMLFGFGLLVGDALIWIGLLVLGVGAIGWLDEHGKPEELNSMGPGGVLGQERLAKIRELVLKKPSRRILEPLGRLLGSLAEVQRLQRRLPEHVQKVMGDLNGPACELVDLGLALGHKAHALEQYLARESVAELEAELENIDERLRGSSMEETLERYPDLERLRDKKTAVLLKKTDLERQLEQSLTRLSLTSTEAEDLLATLYRYAATQDFQLQRQPSAIFNSIRVQLEAVDEMFPDSAATPET